MSRSTGQYRCPLCQDVQEPWSFYPALGQPVCADCDEALLDDDTTLAAACQVFSVTPMLLMQIVEQQRPLVLSTEAVNQRFG